MMSEGMVPATQAWADGLHALSQPLTVLGMALTLAQTSSNEQERSIALDAAVEECHRAMRSVHQMRRLLEPAPDGQARVTRTIEAAGKPEIWPVGGVA